MERRSPSIILKTTVFGEADRLVTFFTEDRGKLRGVAKHAKKSYRRFCGGLEAGTIGVVRYVDKPKAELSRLEDITVMQPAWKLSSSLEKLGLLHVSLELADRMLPLEQASAEKFDLLTRWIGFLSDNEPSPSHRHAFFYKWLEASGLAPVFEKCVICGQKQSGSWHVVPSHGGALCLTCYRAGYGGISASKKLLDYLSGFKVGKMGTSGDRDADKVMEMFILHATGKRLRSLDVAKKLVSI